MTDTVCHAHASTAPAGGDRVAVRGDGCSKTAAGVGYWRGYTWYWFTTGGPATVS
ncbi:hypothetical protein ACUN9Y_05160 [Halomonas sp. V046]|uniref:hypothetical protein n=1 Tax=Halomonas sp. V046 TaxID=3459611 RepID=UPI004044A097